MRYLILFLLFAISGCAGVEPEPEKEKAALVLSPAGFSALPGWEGDDHLEALEAFRRSCTSYEAAIQSVQNRQYILAGIESLRLIQPFLFSPELSLLLVLLSSGCPQILRALTVPE